MLNNGYVALRVKLGSCKRDLNLHNRFLRKQYRSRWDGSLQAILSGSTLLIILLSIEDWNPYLHQWTCPISRIEESTSETQEWKG